MHDGHSLKHESTSDQNIKFAKTHRNAHAIDTFASFSNHVERHNSLIERMEDE